MGWVLGVFPELSNCQLVDGRNSPSILWITARHKIKGNAPCEIKAHNIYRCDLFQMDILLFQHILNGTDSGFPNWVSLIGWQQQVIQEKFHTSATRGGTLPCQSTTTQTFDMRLIHWTTMETCCLIPWSRLKRVSVKKLYTTPIKRFRVELPDDSPKSLRRLRHLVTMATDGNRD